MWALIVIGVGTSGRETSGCGGGGATARLALTPGVINPNRGPGSVTRVITR